MTDFGKMQIFYTDAAQTLVPVNDGVASAYATLELTSDGICFCQVNAEMPSGFDADCALVLKPKCCAGELEFMACEAYSLYWCRPAFGKKL